MTKRSSLIFYKAVENTLIGISNRVDFEGNYAEIA